MGTPWCGGWGRKSGVIGPDYNGTDDRSGEAARSQMTWFRSRIRPVTRLALFALAFQMAVSFGHMDADELGLPSLGLTSRTHLALTATNTAIAPPSREHAPAMPEGYCPICASMALIATAFPSLPPVLVVPPQARPVWPAPIRAEGISPKVALSFQARAPPILV
jgi:Protein of unknown function (DUF2946)